MTARGIRNHNPGNIISTGAAWKGLAAPGQMTEAQRAEDRFCVFSAPWWGIRALAKLLLRYYHHHGLTTPRGIISRWAPGHENPTDAYVQYVAHCLGMGPTDHILMMDYDHLEPLVEAIIEFENGTIPYTWELPTGIILAGIEPKAKSYD